MNNQPNKYVIYLSAIIKETENRYMTLKYLQHLRF